MLPLNHLLQAEKLLVQSIGLAIPELNKEAYFISDNGETTRIHPLGCLVSGIWRKGDVSELCPSYSPSHGSHPRGRKVRGKTDVRSLEMGLMHQF